MSRAATATETSTDLVDAAQHALEHVGHDPRIALSEADAVVAAIPRPRTREDVGAFVTAQRAAGLALRGLGDKPGAVQRIRKGIRAAERAGEPEYAGEARMTLSFLLLESGQLRPALATIDQALASLSGMPAARARTNRALILHRSGRPREALAEYAAALPVIRRAGDGYAECLLRTNRAQLYAEQGETAAALADQTWARDYDLEEGRSADAADDLWNLGMIHALSGDIPRALDLLEQADQEWGGLDRPQRYVDRAELLLEAGLIPEAAELARRGVEWAAERPGGDYFAAEARLWLALALLALPRPELPAAEEEAGRAAAAFARQGRPDFHLVASYVELKVRLSRGARAADLERARDLASLLRDRGRDAHSADLRISAGRVALSQRDVARGRSLLGPLANQTGARQLEVRSRAWFARALLQREAADPGVSASLLRAWHACEGQRALVGASDLRAVAASHASDIVSEGVRIAAEASHAGRAFEWAERGRAAALRHPPVRAPHDPELAAALTRLRWSTVQEEESLRQGEVDRVALTQRRRHEAEVLRLTRRRSGGGRAPRTATVADVRRSLEDEVLVEYACADDLLLAVVVEPDRATLRRVARVADVRRDVETLLFALRRILLGAGSAAARARLQEIVRTSSQGLEDMLLPGLSGRSVVVSPSGPVNQLPWSALPLARHGRLTVAPSASAWLSARERAGARPRSVLVVAGPGLPGADREADLVAELHPASRSLVHPHAGVDATLRAMDAATLVHIAAHGHLRSDNPLFSALTLSDGPLTGYDLETLDQAPSEVVLSACSSGAGRDLASDELLGLAWTLLGAGSSTVLAPLLPVPDAETSTLMATLHERLARGMTLAAGWADVLADGEELGPQAAVAAAFVLYGA